MTPLYPVAEPGPPRRRRGLLLPLLLVLLLVGGGVGAFAWANSRGGDQNAVSDDAASTTSESTTSSEETSPASTTTPTTPAMPTQAPEPTRVRCWDGARRASLDKCDELSGFGALEWVFPNVRALSAQCTEETTEPRFVLSCFDASGNRLFTVSDWKSFGAGSAYYNRTTESAPSTLPDGRLLWRGVAAVKQEPKSALMYPDLSFGITVYADSFEALDARVDRVRMRPLDVVSRYAR